MTKLPQSVLKGASLAVPKSAAMRQALRVVLAIVLALLPATARAQDVQAFTPDMARQIDRIAEEQIRNRLTPGLAIGVVSNGLLVYARGYGYAQVARRRPVTPGTQFYAGSVMKQFTAAAVLLLAQQRKLSLTDRIDKYVPELHVNGNATIAQLLQQTSGLPDYTKARIPQDVTRPTNMATIVRGLNEMPAAAPPGALFAYNNVNYMLAALIVARASGLPFSVFVQSNLFQPLVMTSTFLAGDQGIGKEAATGYTRLNGRMVPTKLWDPSWLFGAGSLVSNVYDLAKWDIGMPLLLNVESVSTMWTASGAPGATAYGMGWLVDQRGGKRYLWHNGVIGGFHAMNAVLPDDHLAVVVLANVDPLHGPATEPERVAAQILDVVAPLPTAHFENTIIERAKEWIGRLQQNAPDRTQLTPQFDQYLTTDVIAKANLSALGTLQSLTPLESRTVGTDTAYVFLARFTKGSVRYTMSITPQGKIDGLLFA